MSGRFDDGAEVKVRGCKVDFVVQPKFVDHAEVQLDRQTQEVR
jgi:hypothetical protein